MLARDLVFKNDLCLAMAKTTLSKWSEIFENCDVRTGGQRSMGIHTIGISASLRLRCAQNARGQRHERFCRSLFLISLLIVNASVFFSDQCQLKVIIHKYYDGHRVPIATYALSLAASGEVFGSYEGVTKYWALRPS